MVNQIKTVVTKGSFNYQTWEDPEGRHHIKGASLGERELVGASIKCREDDLLCLFDEQGARIFQSSWPIKEIILLGQRAE
ncbi:MAG: hypothetical protein Q8O97_01635 [bacterium]|nr:hypothetical protein [bacterium]